MGYGIASCLILGGVHCWGVVILAVGVAATDGFTIIIPHDAG